MNKILMLFMSLQCYGEKKNQFQENSEEFWVFTVKFLEIHNIWWEDSLDIILYWKTKDKTWVDWVIT